MGFNNLQVETLKALIEHNIHLDQKMKGASELYGFGHMEKYPGLFQWLKSVRHVTAPSPVRFLCIHRTAEQLHFGCGHQERLLQPAAVHLFSLPYDAQMVNSHSHIINTFLSNAAKPLQALRPVHFRPVWAGAAKLGERSALLAFLVECSCREKNWLLDEIEDFSSVDTDV